MQAFMILAQTAAPPAPSDAGALQVNSAFDFLMKGGWPMAPIALCSLVALAIIVERALVLRRARVIPRSFVARLTQAAGDRQKSLELCRKDGSPIARILEVAIRRSNEPQELLRGTPSAGDSRSAGRPMVPAVRLRRRSPGDGGKRTEGGRRGPCRHALAQ